MIGGEFEGLGLGLAEAVGGEAEGSGTEGGGCDAADEVAVFGPEVEGAAAVLGGEGVFCGAEVEEGFAIFEEEGSGVLGQEGFEVGGDGFGGLGRFRGRGSGRHEATLTQRGTPSHLKYAKVLETDGLGMDQGMTQV